MKFKKTKSLLNETKKTFKGHTGATGSSTAALKIISEQIRWIQLW